MVYNPNGVGESQAEQYVRPTPEQITEMNKAASETACSNCVARELDGPKRDAITDNETARWEAYQRCKRKGTCKA